MGLVLRAVAVYAVVLVVLRLAGRRTLGEMSSFDLVILLIISEATQEALLDSDSSLTGGIIVIVTLVLLNIGLSLFKRGFPRAELWLEGVPQVIVERGEPRWDLMRKARVSEDDVMKAARSWRGLERMEQVKFAVLEANGDISIIPYSDEGEKPPARPKKKASRPGP